MQQRINLYCDEKIVKPVLHMVQGDTGRQIRAHIVDLGITEDMLYTFALEKPSGLSVYNSAEYADGDILINVTNQMLAEVGNSKAQIKITDTSGKVSSFYFYIYVEQSTLSEDAIESSNEYKAFETMAQDFANLKKQFENAMSAVSSSTELTDIRVSHDGHTYVSAGEAVRTQAKELAIDIDTISASTDNIYDGLWDALGSSGTAITASTVVRSAIIEVEPNTNYCIEKILSNRFRISETNVYPVAGTPVVHYETHDAATRAKITTTANTHYLCIMYYNSSDSAADPVAINRSIMVYKGTVYKDDFVPHLTAKDMVARAALLYNGILPSCDLNDVKGEMKVYALTAAQTYINVPNNENTGFLIVLGGAFTLQIFVRPARNVYYMRAILAGDWSDWVEGDNELTNIVNPFDAVKIQPKFYELSQSYEAITSKNIDYWYALFDELKTQHSAYITKNLLGYGEDASGNIDNTLPIYEYVISPYYYSSPKLPTICVTAAIHGNEQGSVVGCYEVVKKLFDASSDLSALRARAIFKIVPVCNPGGINANTRNNLRAIDINRGFKTSTTDYLTNESRVIGEWLDSNLITKRDILFDMHNSQDAVGSDKFNMTMVVSGNDFYFNTYAELMTLIQPLLSEDIMVKGATATTFHPLSSRTTITAYAYDMTKTQKAMNIEINQYDLSGSKFSGNVLTRQLNLYANWLKYLLQ